MRLLYSLLPIAAIFFQLQNVQAAQIALWSTFDQVLESRVNGRNAVLKALALMNSEDPEHHEELVLRYLEEAKGEKHPCAYYLLGVRERDPQKRVELLREAFDRGILAAIYGLADALYRHGEGNESDFAEAYGLFERANQWPTEDSLFYLGRMCHLGHGTDVDYKAARKYYKQSVEYGSVRAANNLGNLWAEGKGGESNMPMAMSYLHYASNRGMAMASFNLGQKYRTKVADAPNYQNALKYYELAVEQASWNYAAPAYWAGWIYMYGKAGKVNPEKAYPLLKAAAEGKFHRAYFTLAWYYESGQSGVSDIQTANQYYRLVVANGHPQAMNNLAWNLWELNGPQGMVEAEPLFRAAIDEENQYAMTNFGYLNLWKKWSGADSDYGLKLTLKAAERGSRQAIDNLCYYYEGETGSFEPDTEKVAYWRKRLNELSESN